MHLALIKGENFRLLQRLEIEPRAKINLILGENATGKTSLLEAIYCLGRGKSFRGNGPSEMAGQAGRSWRVTGKLLRQIDTPAMNLGVRWNTEGTGIRVGETIKPSTADLVSAMPVQILDPGMHRLLQDGPGYRRSFLDWGVFHVEHQFLPTWRRHQRALKQRNRALRQKASNKEIYAWNPELAETAGLLHKFRTEHLQALQPILHLEIAKVFGTEDWSIDLYPGWSTDSSYLESLEKQVERDRRMGTTVEGAHRAELQLRLRQHQVKNRISRGQQKLLIAAMVLAQSRLIHKHREMAPILLVDDFAAELASDFQRLFASMLHRYPGQLFITSFERLPAFEDFTDPAMFHVEHGQVCQC